LAVDAVHNLKAEIGIPMNLHELGVEEEDLRALAEATAQVTRLLQMNPRPLDVDALEAMLREAW
jgi:alcohol dehydrogenase